MHSLRYSTLNLEANSQYYARPCVALCCVLVLLGESDASSWQHYVSIQAVDEFNFDAVHHKSLSHIVNPHFVLPMCGSIAVYRPYLGNNEVWCHARNFQSGRGWSQMSHTPQNETVTLYTPASIGTSIETRGVSTPEVISNHVWSSLNCKHTGCTLIHPYCSNSAV